MAEYQKLNSEDSGLYGISKFLNENIPFGKKPSFLSKFQKISCNLFQTVVSYMHIAAERRNLLLWVIVS